MTAAAATVDSHRPISGSVIAVKGVTKRFGGVVALHEVSFGVAAGEVCGLIGPNGAGKTTLFDVMSGVTAPTRGLVELDGVDITRRLPERRARAGLRRTFQRVQLYGRLSVVDNVVAAMEWRGGGGGLVADLLALPARRRREADRRQRALDVLDRCGLTELRSRAAGSLPIGQARLVELARAMVDEPRVLLLDEPTSGLSDHEAGRLGELIGQLRADGVAVVLVEHDVGFVMGNSDRVIALNLGEILAEGTPAEIQSNPLVREAYLG